MKTSALQWLRHVVWGWAGPAAASSGWPSPGLRHRKKRGDAVQYDWEGKLNSEPEQGVYCN